LTFPPHMDSTPLEKPDVIQTAADLLNELFKKEQEMLASYQIAHAPTIGEMYEGLTQKKLKQSLPTFLKVVSGFARYADGNNSGQLDCMVVLGDGEQVPNTTRWIYPIHQVIAVVEVKKNFTRADLSEGNEALAKLAWAKPAESQMRLITLIRAFETISGNAYPDDKKSIPPALMMVHHFLVGEVLSPVRILLGFHGYKTENGLRKALSEVIASAFDNKQGGISPRDLPSLIVGQDAVAMKGNALPWGAPMEDGWWRLLFTSGRIGRGRAILEVIWSRLNYLGLVGPDVFGDDRKVDAWNLLLSAKFHADQHGWAYDLLPVKAPRAARTVNAVKVSAPWEPVRLTDKEADVVTWLCKDEELDLDSPPNNAPSREQLEALLLRLASTGHVGAVAGLPNRYRLLTTKCCVVRLPDGAFVAGDNSTGRLTRWVQEQQANRQQGRPPP
jgi:hypothetical protein